MTLKNIQIIDGAENATYDIFAATDEEFALIFPAGQNIAFIAEVLSEGRETELDLLFTRLWARRMTKHEVIGIHGTLFYGLDQKMKYYPTRNDEAAVNPDGSLLRAS